MKVLLVEDDERLGEAIRKGLIQRGMVVDWVRDGEEGLDLACSAEFEVVILDRLLPGMDGVEIVKEMRSEGVGVGVLMLTALGQIDEKIDGLSSGADDYLVKPFDFGELVARIEALGRRRGKVIEDVVEIGDLRVDFGRHVVARSGNEIELSRREFAVLECLVRNNGRAVSRDKILEFAWEFDADVSLNSVDVYVGYLRKKIDRGYGNDLIRTVRGIGFKIDE